MASWFTRRRIVGATVLVLVVAGIGGTVAALYAKKPAVPLQFLPADLAFVESKPLSRWLPVSGTLQPVRQAIVKAKVAGDVLQVTVREGETVKAGQMLARIDTSDLDARLIDRMGALESAKAQLAL